MIANPYNILRQITNLPQLRNSILCINTMFYIVVFLMTVIRIIVMQLVDYLPFAAFIMHFHSSNDRFGLNNKLEQKN